MFKVSTEDPNEFDFDWRHLNNIICNIMCSNYSIRL